jgi:hypothetical protein
MYRNVSRCVVMYRRIAMSIRCTNDAQGGRRPQAEYRESSNDLLAVRWSRCSPHLFRDLSSAARVEYVPVVLVDVVPTTEKRGEGVSLVYPLVAQMTLSVAVNQRVTISCSLAGQINSSTACR